MDEVLPQHERKLREKIYFLSIYKRLVAFTTYYSGLLDRWIKSIPEINSHLWRAPVPWRILRYEHIVEPKLFDFPFVPTSYVTPETFAKHLQYLRKHCKLISLTELIKKILALEPIETGTVAITFDGGWLDTYTNAFPLLLNYNIPATVFLPTSYIGGTKRMWPELLIDSLLLFKKYGVLFPEFNNLSEHFRLRLQQLFDQEGEEVTLSKIMLVLHELRIQPPRIVNQTMDVLYQASEDLGGLAEINYFINWEQAQEMQQRGIDFGTSGHEYLMFDFVSEQKAILDIRESFLSLSNHNLTNHQLFAFPEGLLGTPTLETLKNNGILYALGLDRSIQLDPKGNICGILERVTMDEISSFNKELFFCRMWGAHVLGITF